MFITWRDMNDSHPATEMCERGAERKRRCLVEEEAWVGLDISLQKYGSPLVLLSSFKYLGRAMTKSDDDCLKVVTNMMKERRKCSRITSILG